MVRLKVDRREQVAVSCQPGCSPPRGDQSSGSRRYRACPEWLRTSLNLRSFRWTSIGAPRTERQACGEVGDGLPRDRKRRLCRPWRQRPAPLGQASVNNHVVGVKGDVLLGVLGRRPGPRGSCRGGGRHGLAL